MHVIKKNQTDGLTKQIQNAYKYTDFSWQEHSGWSSVDEYHMKILSRKLLPYIIK